MSFNKNKYIIIKKAIPLNLVKFIYNYFLLKRNIVTFLLNTNKISENIPFIGTSNDKYIQNTYSEYSDFVMETLLSLCKPILEKKIKLKLIETYSYARVYKKGDILKRHKDREACEISVTLNLGGDLWPFFLKKDNKDIKVNLYPSDLLIYRGCELEHWREEFNGNICVQVFLHYNDINGPFKLENKYDKRKFLGYPLQLL
jgi:hypothetical protein